MKKEENASKEHTMRGWEISVCPVCGKEFLPAPAHAYRAGDKPVCSWTCLVEYDRSHSKKRKYVKGLSAGKRKGKQNEA